MISFRKHLKNQLAGELLSKGNIGPSKLLSHFFSSLRPSSQAQKAIIAYYMLKYILALKPSSYLRDNRSVRERFLDRKYFNAFVLNKIKNLPSIGAKQSRTEDWINDQLQQKNYKEIIKAFQINVGVRYNSLIWLQNRFCDVAIKTDWIVLSPSLITKKYFSRLHPGKNSILSGQKGIGKSFSFLIYDYLSSFINICKIYQPTFAAIQNCFLPLDSITVSQKICYINLKENNKYQQYFQQIKIQFNELISSSEINEKWHTNNCSNDQQVKNLLISFLKQVKSRYINKDIKIIGVIDQANRIFRLFRNLQKIINDQKLEISQKKNTKIYSQSPLETQIQPKKWKQSNQFKSLIFLGDLLQILTANSTTSFKNIIFNSSQDFELEYLNTIGSSVRNELKISSILATWKVIDQKSIFSSNYSRNMQEQSGHIQLYNCYWLEILRLLQYSQMIEISNEVQQFSKQRKIFFEAFKAGKNYQIWKNDVKWLQIRDYLSKLQQLSSETLLLKEQGNILLKSEWSSEEEQLFKKEVIKIKKDIEYFRKKTLIKNLQRYFEKITNNDQFEEKKQYIDCIYKEAKLKKELGEKGPIFKYKAIDIPKEKRSSFISAIGFGYNYYRNNQNQIQNDESPQSYLIFSSDPTTLMYVISKTKLSIHYCILSFNHIYKLLTSKLVIDRNKTYGIILDNLSYQYLLNGNLNIQIKQFVNIQQPQNEPTGQIYTYFISSTTQFRGFTKIVSQYSKNRKQVDILDSEDQQIYDQYPISEADLRVEFSKLVSLAKKKYYQKDTYYLGCYAVIQSAQIVEICGNQRTFDCMILRLSNQQTLQIRFFDWTMGKITSKKTNYMKQIQKLLSYISFKGKIECKILIVAPDYQVQRYLNDISKKGIKPKGGYYKFEKDSKSTEISSEKSIISEQKIDIVHAEINSQSFEIFFGFASFDRNAIFSLNKTSKDHAAMTKIVSMIYDAEEHRIFCKTQFFMFLIESIMINSLHINKLIQRVIEKALVLLKTTSVEDVKNCNDKFFHIHHLVRGLWKAIENKIEEVK